MVSIRAGRFSPLAFPWQVFAHVPGPSHKASTSSAIRIAPDRSDKPEPHAYKWSKRVALHPFLLHTAKGRRSFPRCIALLSGSAAYAVGMPRESEPCTTGKA
jgi:hypothetical protein